MARPLPPPKRAKAEGYLELARILVTRFGNDTNGRAAQFLVDLIQNRTPGPLPPLTWFETPGQPEVIDMGHPGVLNRLAPTIRFRANFRVRR